MSISIGLKFLLSPLSKSEVEQILSKCVSEDWTVNNQDKVSFFIDTEFDWKACDIKDWLDVKSKIIESFIKGNTCGLTILSKDNTGGDLLFIDKNEIIFSISINAKRKEGLIDVEWYLFRLKQIFEDVLIEEIEIIH